MKKIISIFLFIFFSSNIFPQWTNYNQNNTQGLGGDMVSDMIALPDGKVLIATNNGLKKYDKDEGSFSNYPDLQNKLLLDIYTSGLLIWTGTNGYGVYYYNGNLWTNYNSDNGLAGNIVRGITNDNAGNMWLATYGGGISKYNGTSWTTYGTAQGLPTNFFYSAFKDNDGNLWFGTSGHGVLKYNGSEWTSYTVADGLAGSTVLKIYEYDSFMWFCCVGGVSAMHEEFFTNYTTDNGLAGNIAYCMVKGNDNKFRIGTNNGVSIIGSSIENIDTSNGLANNKVISICQSTNGFYCYGHENNGMTIISGQEIQNFFNWNGLASNYVYKACETSDGSLWFATSYGVTRKQGNIWTTYNTNSGVNIGYVNDIAIEANNNVWAACNYNGLYKFNGETWQQQVIPGVSSQNVTSVYVDSQGSIWVNIHNYGVYKFSNNQWTNFSNGTSISGHSYIKIFEDSQGKMWFYSYNALHCYSNSSGWTIYTQAEHGIPNNYVTGITEDQNGFIWIATRGQEADQNWCISKFDGTHWNNYWASIHNSYLNFIFCDSNNKIWTGGNSPYYNNVAVTLFDGVNWSFHTTSDGLPSAAVINAFEDSQGNIWLCTNSGISKGDITIVKNKEPEITEEAHPSVFPNPASGKFVFKYSLNKASLVQFELTDVYGHVVMSENFRMQNEGEHQYTVDVTKYASGLYFLIFTDENRRLTNKIVIKNN